MNYPVIATLRHPVAWPLMGQFKTIPAAAHTQYPADIQRFFPGVYRLGLLVGDAVKGLRGKMIPQPK